MVKSTSDKLVSMTAIVLGHAPLGLLAMPFVPVPPVEAWPILAASVVVHASYQLCLIQAYRLGDFTQVYPIARGSGPAIITLFSIFVLGVDLSVSEILAICLIVTGIFCLSLLRQSNGLRNPKAVGAALLTGCFIAGYSMLDGHGARISGSAFGFIAWMTVINSAAFALMICLFRPDAFKRVFTEGQRTLWIGGSASVLAYVLVVWAMTQAPIAIVTALRETSTVFALLIGVLFLKENLTVGKVVATLLTLSGVLLLRFGF